MEEKIRQGLKYLIENGKKEFVIFPYGNYGQITKKMLNEEFHLQELYIVDNFKSQNDSSIRNMEYLKADYGKRDFTILMAIDPLQWDVSLEVHRQLMKFATIDRLADILAWSPYYTPWNHYGKINLLEKPKMAALECIAREIYKNGVRGEIAEAGVFQGQTARYMNVLFPDRKLYLFDTFEGFNKRDQENDDVRKMFNEKLDFTNTSEKLVLDRMHYVNNCIIKKGWFPQSASGVEDTFAFVRLDMDLYDPIYAGLDFFYPRMEKGGYIIVHDCRSKNFDGARNALIDFCRKKQIGYMCMPDNLGSAVISIGL